MARRAARRWQGWAVNTRTNAELEAVFAARRQQHAAEVAKRREKLGHAAAPLISETLPPHTGWLTLDDVCVFADIELEEADAGCELLERSGELQRQTVSIEAFRQPLQLVRRAPTGTLDAGPLRAWLEAVLIKRFDDDVAEAAASLETSEEFLRRVLDDNCGRLLLEAADWLFVRAGEPHQLPLLYPADETGSEPTNDVAS